MRTSRKFTVRSVVAGLVVCLSVSGCVTTNGPGNGAAAPEESTADNSECNIGLLAVGGAVVGGLLGTGKNRLRGAALGAGLASLACAAWNYNVKQTRTAEQVNAEYQANNRGKLPEQAKVVRYDSRFTPSGRVAPGGQVVMNSTIEVVGGTKDTTAPLVEEEVSMTRPDGKLITSRKVINQQQGAGGYQSTFTMSMPKGVSEGEYPVKTALFLNGQPAGSRTLTMQVVWSGAEAVRVAGR